MAGYELAKFAKESGAKLNLTFFEKDRRIGGRVKTIGESKLLVSQNYRWVKIVGESKLLVSQNYRWVKAIGESKLLVSQNFSL